MDVNPDQGEPNPFEGRGQTAGDQVGWVVFESEEGLLQDD